MPDLFAFGAARGATRLIYLQAVGTLGIRAEIAVASRDRLQVRVAARDGEAQIHLGARALSQLEELARIAETVAQTWPRLDGEAPSPADHWCRAGFTDADVVAWLEAGVPWASAAAELRAVHLAPRDVAGEHADGVTLGLAFARRELTLAEVQRAVLGEEVAG